MSCASTTSLIIYTHFNFYLHFFTTGLSKSLKSWSFLIKFCALVCSKPFRMCSNFSFVMVYVPIPIPKRYVWVCTKWMCVFVIFSWFKVDRNWKCSMRVIYLYIWNDRMNKQIKYIRTCMWTSKHKMLTRIL